MRRIKQWLDCHETLGWTLVLMFPMTYMVIDWLLFGYR